MSLKFTEDLSVMTMKNYAKFERELVISKLTWRIWWILTWALESLKNFHFNGFLLSKVYIAWTKKSTEELSFMKLKKDAKFGEESTCRFKMCIRNLTILTMTLKFAEKLCVMTMKNHAKFEEQLTCHFKTDIRNLTNFDLSTRKSKKIAI